MIQFQGRVFVHMSNASLLLGFSHPHPRDLRPQRFFMWLGSLTSWYSLDNCSFQKQEQMLPGQLRVTLETAAVLLIPYSICQSSHSPPMFKGECQGHIVEEQWDQEILLWPYLEHKICHNLKSQEFIAWRLCQRRYKNRDVHDNFHSPKKQKQHTCLLIGK